MKRFLRSFNEQFISQDCSELRSLGAVEKTQNVQMLFCFEYHKNSFIEILSNISFVDL